MRAWLMLAILAVAAPDRLDPRPMDNRPLKEKMDGQWQLVNSVISGQGQDPSSFPATVYTFSPGRLVTRSAKQPQGASFGVVLDDQHTPAHIDFIAGSAEPKTTYPGIVKLEGDLLTLCFTRSVNGQRPTEFAAPADAQRMIALFQFKRIGG